MAEKDRVSAPTSSAGLIRFYDVTSSNILLDPKVVVGLAVAFVLAVLFLQFA